MATVWVQQLGLAQHSETFLNNFVDGAVLNSLTRRDMERHLGISRKFHQVSKHNPGFKYQSILKKGKNSTERKGDGIRVMEGGGGGGVSDLSTLMLV